jgi:hypothetical protein
LLGPQYAAGSLARGQQHLASPASRRPVSSSARRSTSAPLDDSSSGSDSDSDDTSVQVIKGTSVLAVNPSDLGADGFPPWYYRDEEVKAAWRITDEQELEHWQEIMASLEK